MTLHETTIDGGMLESGFWVYVVSVEQGQESFLYVGMTGDSSSTNARSPIHRLGNHIGSNRRNNALSQYLAKENVQLDSASFNVTAVKVFDETDDRDLHSMRFAKVNATEQLLAEGLSAAGHQVMNTVNCQSRPDRGIWQTVRGEFSTRFPGLRGYDGGIAASQRLTRNDQSSGQLRFGKGEKFLFPDHKGAVAIRYGSRMIECEWNPRYGPDQDRSGILRIGSRLASRLKPDRVYRAELESDSIRLRIARKDWVHSTGN